MKYVMFLRGINVGGIRVQMEGLRHCLSTLPVSEVKTYLQTGNVTFESQLSALELKPMVEKALTEQFNYTAHVLLYPADVIGNTVADCPFRPDESAHRYAIFCQSKDVILELMSYKDQLDDNVETIAAGDTVVYWRAPKGSSTDTPFSKIIAKPKYKAVTTNRNLNTLEKMV